MWSGAKEKEQGGLQGRQARQKLSKEREPTLERMSTVPN